MTSEGDGEGKQATCFVPSSFDSFGRTEDSDESDIWREKVDQALHKALCLKPMGSHNPLGGSTGPR